MEELYVIDLEDGYPTVDEAMKLLRNEISRAKKCKKKYLYVIHGYGSSGKGGAIRIKARQLLERFCKDSKLFAVIKGEEFNIFNVDACKLIGEKKCFSDLAKKCNHGITVVVM